MRYGYWMTGATSSAMQMPSRVWHMFMMIMGGCWPIQRMRKGTRNWRSPSRSWMMELETGRPFTKIRAQWMMKMAFRFIIPMGKWLQRMKHGLQMTVRTLMEIQNQQVRYIPSHVCPLAPTSFRRSWYHMSRDIFRQSIWAWCWRTQMRYRNISCKMYLPKRRLPR